MGSATSRAGDSFHTEEEMLSGTSWQLQVSPRLTAKCDHRPAFFNHKGT